MLAGACGDDGSGNIDAASGGPDGPPGTPDAEPGTPDATPGTPDAGSACGTEELPVADITGTEGLAIAADGTFYYSQDNAIGRRRPGMGVENQWVALPAADTVWGLALTPDGTTLYVATPNPAAAVYMIDTTAATPAAVILYDNAGAANGIVVGPDGAVYYSNINNGNVYRIDPATIPGTRTTVTTSQVPAANGLLFEPDGTLLVLAYSNADIWRLTLAAGTMVETGRVLAGSVTLANVALDGIARDEEGRYYLGDNDTGRLLRVDSAFANPEILLTGLPNAANIAFGRGALNCHDVYVASGGDLGLFHGDAAGVP